MKPISFPQQNCTYTEDHPEYYLLPAHRNKATGEVISCWKLSYMERIKILIFGILWIRNLTFSKTFHPVLPQVVNPFIPADEGK